MEFGVEQFAMLIMKYERREMTKQIKLPNQNYIQNTSGN